MSNEFAKKELELNIKHLQNSSDRVNKKIVSTSKQVLSELLSVLEDETQTNQHKVQELRNLLFDCVFDGEDVSFIDFLERDLLCQASTVQTQLYCFTHVLNSINQKEM